MCALDANSGLPSRNAASEKIFNEEGLVLLGEAVQLSEAYIDRLSKMGISYVYIEDNRTEGIEAPSLLSEETRRKRRS